MLKQKLARKNSSSFCKNSYLPMFKGCEKASLQVVQYLIEKGANIEARDHRARTPLHFASYYCKTDVIKYFVSKGANKKAKNKWNQTPYDVVPS